MRLTLSIQGQDVGIVEWDSDAGTFVGYAADVLDALGDGAEGPAAFPSCSGSAPRRDARALLGLLHTLGYDPPKELHAAMREVRAACGTPQDPHLAL